MASQKIQAIGAYIIDGCVFLRQVIRDRLGAVHSLGGRFLFHKKKSRDIIHSRSKELNRVKDKKNAIPCFISRAEAPRLVLFRERKRKGGCVWVSGGKGV